MTKKLQFRNYNVTISCSLKNLKLMIEESVKTSSSYNPDWSKSRLPTYKLLMMFKALEYTFEGFVQGVARAKIVTQIRTLKIRNETYNIHQRVLMKRRRRASEINLYSIRNRFLEHSTILGCPVFERNFSKSDQHFKETSQLDNFGKFLWH